MDANGNVATGFLGTVYISSSDPLATTAAGYAFNPADAGIPYMFTATDAGSHTFTGAIRLVTGGVQTVKVAAPNMAPAAATVNVTGQVTHLGVTAPAAGNAGDTFDLTVTAIDTTGAVAPGYTSTIHFTSSDALAGLPTDYTFTAADGGVHTFTVGLHTSTPHLGSWSVSVVDTKIATSLTTIPGFEVVNGAAAKIELSVPSGVTAGTPFSLKVTVVDAWGNTVKNYFGTVHFADTAGVVGLPPDYTFTAADSGAANIPVTLSTAGNQVLSVTDTANPTLTASATVSPKTATASGGGGGGGKGGTV